MALLHVVVCLALLGNDADDVLNQAKQIRQKRIDQYSTRMEKQVACHLTPAGIKVYTPNRPVEDKDLFDRVLPANELAVLCDALDQTTVDGKPTWKFIGNVCLHATRVSIFCHELTVTQDKELLVMDISGGREFDPLSPPPALPELSAPDGNAFIVTERKADKPFEFEGCIAFRAGQLKQKLDTGAYSVIVKTPTVSAPPSTRNRKI
ncbi:MAG: hypothetical protein JWP89_6388 [Schlesneria sp.]|nr:hypothetical protein [Schlesneria sp.]